LIIGIIRVLAGIAIAIITGKMISKPITRISRTLKDISEGEGDLTRRISNSSKDEIGDLARYFNLTIEKIKCLIIMVKTESVSLSGTGAEQINAAVNEVNGISEQNKKTVDELAETVS
jgi:methyl-accepting chemotaxis protein